MKNPLTLSSLKLSKSRNEQQRSRCDDFDSQFRNVDMKEFASFEGLKLKVTSWVNEKTELTLQQVFVTLLVSIGDAVNEKWQEMFFLHVLQRNWKWDPFASKKLQFDCSLLLNTLFNNIFIF